MDDAFALAKCEACSPVSHLLSFQWSLGAELGGKTGLESHRTCAIPSILRSTSCDSLDIPVNHISGTDETPGVGEPSVITQAARWTMGFEGSIRLAPEQ